jgi:polyisoprenoid-binding protein YceI
VSVAVRYAIDQQASKFTARAYAAGMLSAFAHSPEFAIRKFSGEADFDPSGAGSLTLTIKADSLDLMDDVSKRDRWDINRIMNEELLETARYPEITYSCPSEKVSAKSGDGSRFEVTLQGELTLHGVTRSQPVIAHVVVGDGSLRAYGDFIIKQLTYGLKPVTAAGSGIKVKEDVKIAFDIVARKQ